MKKTNKFKLFKTHSKRLQSRTGQGITEYIILLALIGVASIAMVQILSKNIRAKYHVASEALRGKTLDSKDHGEASNPRNYDKVDMGDFHSKITDTSKDR